MIAKARKPLESSSGVHRNGTPSTSVCYLLARTALPSLLAFLFAVSTAQSAEPNFFGNFRISNESGKDIAVQWGWFRRSWQNVVIKAGTYHDFSWPYDFANQNKSPTFQFGIWNAVNGHKANYHAYTIPSPNTPGMGPAYWSWSTVKAVGNNVYAETNDYCQQGHWSDKDIAFTRIWD